MTIEGIRDYEAVRDFLYTRMRGARDIHPKGDTSTALLRVDTEAVAELTETLRATAGEIHAIRLLMEDRKERTT